MSSSISNQVQSPTTTDSTLAQASYSMYINVKARQAPLPAGMARVLSLLESAVLAKPYIRGVSQVPDNSGVTHAA